MPWDSFEFGSEIVFWQCGLKHINLGELLSAKKFPQIISSESAMLLTRHGRRQHGRNKRRADSGFLITILWTIVINLRSNVHVSLSRRSRAIDTLDEPASTGFPRGRRSMKRNKLTALILPAVAAFAFVSCSSDRSDSLHRVNRILMGTLVDVSVLGPSNTAKAAAEAILDEIKRVEDLTSFHKPSGLSAINDAAGTQPIKADRELLELIAKGLNKARDTGGAFDPTVGPLCRLWQFSAGEPRLPEAPEIADALTRVAWDRAQIDLAADTVFLPQQGMAMDLGALGKGYALDRANEVIKRLGVSAALVNLGGDILAVGERGPGRPWRVGIQDPRDPRGLVAVAALKDAVIATSGDYERCFFRDDKRYHHILDPKTGYPAEKMQSVTIVAANGVTAQPTATSVFVLGPAKGMKYVQSLAGVEALLIDSEGRISMTSGARSIFEMKR